MEEQLYFDPFNVRHTILLKSLERELMDSKNDIVMCRYGERTQHIFKGGKYVMTLNWNLI